MRPSWEFDVRRARSSATASMSRSNPLGGSADQSRTILSFRDCFGVISIRLRVKPMLDLRPFQWLLRQRLSPVPADCSTVSFTTRIFRQTWPIRMLTAPWRGAWACTATVDAGYYTFLRKRLVPSLAPFVGYNFFSEQCFPRRLQPGGR